MGGVIHLLPRLQDYTSGDGCKPNEEHSDHAYCADGNVGERGFERSKYDDENANLPNRFPLWMARFVAPALLYGVEARDPATMITAAVVLVAVGLIAGWLPARRAARIDPAQVLREA